MVEQKEIILKQLVADFIHKIESGVPAEKKDKALAFPVVAISMEAGSGGSLIAQKVSETLGFELLHVGLLSRMAKNGQISENTLASMEKMRHTGVKDLVSSLLVDHYIHPETYLKYLKDAVASIEKQGRAIIIGRGANFLLPPEKRLGVRIVAPLEYRVKAVSEFYNVSEAEAKKRVTNRDSRRRAFVKDSYNHDIKNPVHYDLIINSALFSVETAADMIVNAVIAAQSEQRFNG